jgi:WD40 repeat protein/tRNA A-37 threonylcarbamoyl transferase component Bud32
MAKDSSGPGEDETQPAGQPTLKLRDAPRRGASRRVPLEVAEAPRSAPPDERALASTGGLAPETSSDSFAPRAMGEVKAADDRAVELAVARLPRVDAATYERIEEHARGGLGRILRAKDVRLGRLVALKVLLRGERGSREAQLRFVREALVTARLQHPAIVPIYEAGRFTDGELFYAMRFVSGQPLHKKIARARTLEERLALLPHVLSVAEAMAYAHSKRFIHRDLKPENILVGEFGEAVVIDWGLAKELGSGARRAAETDAEGLPLSHAIRDELTRHGTIIGTPVYMPPEQARGEAVDERADVYALGAILYYVLTGRRPYTAKSAAQILAQVAAGPPTPVQRREPRAPKELVAIVERAMARRREERYPSANEFVEDLKRFQTGQLVAAHRAAPREAAGRWVRRYALALIVLAALLTAAAVMGAWHLARVEEARDRAEREAAVARAAEAEATTRADELVLLEARASLARDPTASVAWLKRLSAGFEGWSDARGVALEAALRGVARLLPGPSADVSAMAASPDGRSLVTGGADRAARLWDTTSGATRVLAEHPRELTAVAYAPGGDRVATACLDGVVRVLRLPGGEVTAYPSHNDGALSVAFSPDGSRLASTGGDGALVVRDLATGAAATHREHARRAVAVAFSPDGRRVASTGEDGALLVHDLDTGSARPIARRDGTARVLAFAPGGREIALAGRDGAIELLPVDGGAPRVLGQHGAAVLALAVSAEGGALASAGADGRVVAWELASGARRELLGPAAVRAIAFSPDGARLYTRGAGDALRAYPVDSGERVFSSGAAESRALAFFHTGARLAIGNAAGELRVVDVAGGAPRALEGHAIGVFGVEVSPDERLLASGGADKLARVWDAENGRLVASLAHPDGVLGVSFSEDGTRLATACADGVVRAWPARGGEPVVVTKHGGPAYDVAFLPGGRVASASWDKTVRVTDPSTGESRVLAGHGDAVVALAPSPDGATLATASDDHTLRLWDLRSGEARSLPVHASRVLAVAFARDGRTIVSTGVDQAVRMLRADTGAPDGERHLDAPGLDVALSADGRWIAASDAGRAVRVWTNVLPKEKAALRGWLAQATNAEVGARGVVEAR